MKQKVIYPIKSLLLNKRHIIEIINDQLKHLFRIDYTHHRYRDKNQSEIIIL
ncbi:transposase DDE domain protein [Orientia tsutsugamushi str. UT144]|uniref:Transposase DDE domain protein n=1 Tax=Orientia tsutsugamushi str. UT144 TaxID=1441384 RepID=A0A0F3RKX8_ORITS|nr:transposase DDE domain protein [Orientia tsutsugamushi str. UT144]